MAQWTDYTKLRLKGVERTGRKEALGHGSYGRVIEVSVNGTICAAKVIHDILVEEVEKKDFEATERIFLNECANNSRILHPNVVQFLGIHYPSPKDKLPWLIMEMMYTSLTGLIEKYETTDLPLHIKLSILVDTSQGLQYLHSQNIIHRDLSSNNVLVTQYMAAKISDFGMAKMIMPDLRKYTQVPGTLPFMPLEALSVQPRYGKPLDVFSLGCVSVHIISMQWPVPADQTKRDHLTGKRVVSSEVERRDKYLSKMIDESPLKRLTVSCLQDEPEDRPTIENITKELQSIKAAIKLEVKYTNNIVDLVIRLSQLEKVVSNKNEVIAELQCRREQEIKEMKTELKTMNGIITDYRKQMDTKCSTLQNQCLALHTELEKERKEARAKVYVYKRKTEQFQVQWRKREDAEKHFQAATIELNAQKELNRQQQNTIEGMLRKNTIAIGKVREELEAQCQIEREEANQSLKAVAKQLATQQELNKQQLAAQQDLNQQQLAAQQDLNKQQLVAQQELNKQQLAAQQEHNKQQIATICKFLQRNESSVDHDVLAKTDLRVGSSVIYTNNDNSVLAIANDQIIQNRPITKSNPIIVTDNVDGQQEWRCHHCGTLVSSRKFCNECGANRMLPATEWHCHGCSTVCSTRFCHVCGTERKQ